ncbi:MAG: flavodoxin [Cardiobacteriaceae bacterium]|nr:flavodoxin [Cardiobacteriaceae bacterium]
MSQEIGFFYGSTTGMTEDVAYRIETYIKEKYNLDIVPINIIDLDDPNDMFLYKRIILGMPTWNYGEYQDDWEMVVDKIANTRIDGTVIAMFGLGDQIGYPEYYLDAMGMLAEQLKAQGATFIGAWPSADYNFTSSKALQSDGTFIGLALDEDSEPEKTQERLEAWVDLVLPQLLA